MASTPRFQTLAQALHTQSERQLVARARDQFKGGDSEFAQLLQTYTALAPQEKAAFLARHGLSSNDDASSTGNTLSLAVSEQTGRFLHNLVLGTRPAVVLELGSSCGVSTLYLADALRQLGHGTVIATEFDPWKIDQLRGNLDAAGLLDWVDVRPGDVMQTLATLQGPVDLAFIDIWATGYLPAFQRLRPLLRPGAIVLADNMFTAGEGVRDFKRHLDEDPGVSTTTLDFESGLEFTVIL